MVLEVELKLRLDAALERALVRLGEPAAKHRLISIYYDTPAGELTAARVALRLRRIDDAWVQTVKAEQGAAFERYEFEQIVGEPRPQLDALPPAGTPIGDLMVRCFSMLEPLFETNFERTSWRITPLPGLDVEVARDLGRIGFHDQSEPIAEVELELKDGAPGAFYRWAGEFIGQHGCGLLLPTKSERGLRLAARIAAQPLAKSGEAVAAPVDAPCTGAAADILRACLAHALANVPVILAGDAAGGPHQFRVGLRRLRAAIRFFDLRAREPAWVALDQRLASCAAVVGKVRDCDVLQAGLMRELQASFPGDAALAGLEHALLDYGQKQRAAAREFLAGPQFAAAVIDVLAALNDLRQLVFDPPRFGDFAPLRAAELSKKVRRRRRVARDESGWHRVRIAVKNLRYGVEFARTALIDVQTSKSPADAEQAIAQVLKALARWQDSLGLGQDLAVARQLAADALHQAALPSHSQVRAVALIDGWRALSGSHGAHRQRIGRRALRALREVTAATAPAEHNGSAQPGEL